MQEIHNMRKNIFEIGIIFIILDFDPGILDIQQQKGREYKIEDR